MNVFEYILATRLNFYTSIRPKKKNRLDFPMPNTNFLDKTSTLHVGKKYDLSQPSHATLCCECRLLYSTDSIL